ncbi:MAG: hypothetical protein ACR2GC_11955 [Methyloceanibacter sp.]|uniref:hypothetical protein n=1 Tax=Methyloceanibacter sp. TaxID=1965321 RepID=UPI003D9ACA32
MSHSGACLNPPLTIDGLSLTGAREKGWLQIASIPARGRKTERPSNAKGARQRRAASGDNQATLVSSGTTFRFEDDLDDVWGEVSAGVNFFNPSASTAVFAKLDVTFGNDVEGIGGKAGMRVSW